MRERDRRNQRRQNNGPGPPNKSYPPGTIQYRLQHAVDESAAVPLHPSSYQFETPDSSLRLELFTELHTHGFKNGIFAQTTIDTSPEETLKLLLDSPALTEVEKNNVLRFREEYLDGMGEENICGYILSLHRLLKMFRRDAFLRNVISEIPATEVTVRREDKLPTILRIDEFGEVTFVGIGDMSIPKAFEGYMREWRVSHDVPPCETGCDIEGSTEPTQTPRSPQTGKSIEALQRMGIRVGGFGSEPATPEVINGNGGAHINVGGPVTVIEGAGSGNGETPTGNGALQPVDLTIEKDTEDGDEALRLNQFSQLDKEDEAFVDRESDSDYQD
ncbi:hypothetical protein HYFRA_00001399 [Hymenoscyphus fraxineus]|uniref:Uncharacterized protein n=1 Tax=Hymenoscyphus fraxineus TaxID=746836 RepID=A0A9N9L3C6_9HELO|nr:hypothetical protein HYFRA_00001399 [Hymenoscyphus fraxineus]